MPVAFGQVVDVPPSRALPSVVYTPLGTLAIGLLVGGLFLGALYSLTRIRRRSWVQQRLAPHVVQTVQRGNQADRLSMLKALFRATEGTFGRHAKWRSIERMLVRGDVPLRPAEFLWLMIGCAVGAAVLCAVAGAPALFALVALVVGGLHPVRVRRPPGAAPGQGVRGAAPGHADDDRRDLEGRPLVQARASGGARRGAASRERRARSAC